MPLRPDLFASAAARNKRFRELFEAHDFLASRINEVLERHGNVLKVKLADPNPTERAADLLAYSDKKRVQYLKLAHGVESPPWPSPVPENEVEQRASSWDKIKIADKANAAGLYDFHYSQGYRFYSSMEHSDAFALNAYIDEWNEVGPVIGSQEGDKYVGIALIHNFAVTADLLLQLCRFYNIERPDIVESLRARWTKLGRE
jgi:hypothetical protein